MINVQAVNIDILNLIRLKIDKNLLLFVNIGSSNSPSFFKKFSDIDILIIVKKINVKVLEYVSEVRDKISSKYGIKIDIKVFNKAEFANKMGFFLNEWFFMSLMNKKENIFYKSKSVRFPVGVDKKSMLIPILYCIYKLRKIFLRTKFDKRGRNMILDKQEENKNIISTYFSIIKFSLCYFGIYAFFPEDIVSKSIFFGKDVNVLTKKIYKIKVCDLSLSYKDKKEILNRTEKIYGNIIESMRLT